MSFVSRSDPRGPIFLYGVSFAPEGRYSTKLGVSKYRTIWLKNAEFRPLTEGKIPIFCMDFTAPKSAFFDPPNPQKSRIEGSPYTTQVKVPSSTQLVERVGSALYDIRKSMMQQEKMQKRQRKQKENRNF